MTSRWRKSANFISPKIRKIRHSIHSLNAHAESVSDNFFAEIEQAAFAPSHLVPGFEPSADPVLQARLFSYPDAHRYRLGVNYQQVSLPSWLAFRD